MTSSMTNVEPEDLRERLIAHLKDASHLHSERIEQALRTVPRHRFVPVVSVEDAYANRAITIKPGEDRPASCASVPTVVAMMLGQLDLAPGENVLEIGAGTGYNASLLAELVGETGHVTTIDIQPDITDHAHAALTDTGYGRVDVVTGDGALGDPEHAPYDKIIVTVGPWDLPPAWSDQLAPGGRLVVPLHWRGQARSIVFVKRDSALVARDSQLCGFIPMIGIVPTGERHGQITDGVGLYWDADQPIDPDTLQTAFTGPATAVWSGASVAANEPFDGIWLRLAATELDTCRFAATDAAINAGVCHPVFPDGTPALVAGDSLAYLTSRRVEEAGQRRHELGVTGHGPAGEHLAERLCAQIRAWDANRTAQPTISAYPAGTPDDDLPTGVIVNKHHTRLVLAF